MRRGVGLLAILLLAPVLASAQDAQGDSSKARLLFQQKNFTGAAAILERIQRSGHPTGADFILLGLCYTELHELDKAEGVLALAAAVSPPSAALLDARGNLAFARKRYADAVDLFREARRLDPRDADARAGLVASLSNRGVELVGQGTVDEARKLFLEAVGLDPGSIPALRNLALVEMGSRDLAAAGGHLEQALQLSPNDVQLLKLLFIVRNDQGDKAAMMTLLDRLVALQPSDPEPHAALGRLLEQQGRAQDAARLFGEAVSLGTQDPLPYLRVGEARRDRYALHDAIAKAVQMISALQTQESQAVGRARGPEDLKGAKLISIKVEDVRSTLGSALSLLREIDGDATFQQDLTRLRSWYPGSVDLLAALARLYQEKDLWADALAAWQQILAQHPVDPDAQAGAGLAYERLGNREQAALSYRRALDMQPESASLYAALRRLYAGRETELRQIYLDLSLRQTRNVVLLGQLADLEDTLGLAADAARHRARAQEIQSGS